MNEGGARQLDATSTPADGIKIHAIPECSPAWLDRLRLDATRHVRPGLQQGAVINAIIARCTTLVELNCFLDDHAGAYPQFLNHCAY